VPRLPWQSTVELAGGLTDQDMFDISSGGRRNRRRSIVPSNR
jgi:hypothetical protein